MLKKLKALFTRVEVDEVKKVVSAKKGLASGLITYLSLILAKHIAPEMDLPPDEVALSIGFLIGGLVNFIKHKVKK